jgi:lipoprotein LprG
MLPRRILRPLLASVAAVLLVPACSGGGGEGADLPDGPALLTRSAEAMRSVKSTAFTIETEGTPPVPVKHADGRLTAEGDADGTIQLDVLGNLQELSFVIKGETVHFKGPTGGFQKMTRAELATVYDPSAILDPEKGVARLLAGATDARTEGEEAVAGAAAYRVAATLSQESLTTLVPGVQQGVNGTLWIDKATSRLLRASLPLGSGSASGTVTVTFSDHDVPVQVTPPAS